ncbi:MULTISPECIES: Ger(x)C family spore germination C-terminal domain-containing protein [Brevibacillus]|uniref:Ger(x)C family spore germination C-terminal domain-containing protein n=1 Tax=Brevibacillus TaxID=55080 RepID=UPI001E50322B|nr:MULTISPECIES: Ger(x)C family spore germination C-terminal domain-containing protein [Brevibacillus]UED69628.1 Ger(x)C family spore germination C-terminal domain-containing protein [Brevibacillus sp. HD3.3A]WDV95904.1 Ger(x)C family spore germination C-terminal domain-containing protein [Brevibacillus parabrevis]
MALYNEHFAKKGIGSISSRYSKMMKTMEDALEKEIEKELQKVVKKLQQLDVDPAGFGIVYRAQQRGLKEMTNRDWRKIFRQASFRFHVQATIIRNGVMD